MLAPRDLSGPGLREYWEDIRPRIVLLRVRTGSINIVWGVPLWAIEEVIAFAVGAALLVRAALPLLPPSWRDRAGEPLRKLGVFSLSWQANAELHEEGIAQADARSSAAARDVYALLNEFAGGSLSGLLRLPPGEPYVKVAASGTLVEIIPK